MARTDVKTVALVSLVAVLAACGARNSATPVPSPPAFGSVVNLGPMINSNDFDGGPSLSADGLHLYFISERLGSNGGDIWLASRTSTAAPFGKAVNLGPTVNSSADEGAPSISFDGLELFFDRSPDGHIFVARRSTLSEPFGSPMLVDLGSAVCCDGFPSITASGLELYFCSTRSGGLGSNDVWRASRASRSSAFGSPQNIGPPVNGVSDDCEPGMSKDGLALYFASDREGAIGAIDIWVATRTRTSEAFSRVTNLGPRVNSHFSDERPHLSTDGRTLFFMSNRAGGSGFFDVWQATLAA